MVHNPLLLIKRFFIQEPLPEHEGKILLYE